VFREFWEPISKLFQYRAVLENPVIRDAFLFTSGKEPRVVGSCSRYGNGFVLLLPALGEQNTFLWDQFRQSLPALFTALAGTDEPLPEWANRYRTPLESEIESEAARLREALAEANSKLSEAQKRLAEERKLKILITGTGPSLERAVIDALRKLGFEATPGAPYQDDIRFSFEGRLGVAEVKGVSTSASKKHAAQLDSFCLADDDSELKGFLVVNGFREAPLESRGEVFPPNVVEYCKRRNHCLLTGAQLLSMVLAVRQDSKKGPEIVRKLWETSGVFPDFADISEWLSPGS
jgi:hypothetical protein